MIIYIVVIIVAVLLVTGVLMNTLVDVLSGLKDIFCGGYWLFEQMAKLFKRKSD